MDMTQLDTCDQAFVELVDRYLDRIYRYLRNLTGDDDSARDLCHETFLRLRTQIQRGTEINAAHVFTAARITTLSQWRRNTRESEKHAAWRRDHGADCVGAPPKPASGAATAATAVERKELREALDTALAGLSEDQRTVFLLSEVEGLKYEQISAVLGISAGTVASRKFNAVRALRGKLERLGHALS